MAFEPTKKWLESGKTAKAYNEAVEGLRKDQETASMNRRWMAQVGIKDSHVFDSKPGA